MASISDIDWTQIWQDSRQRRTLKAKGHKEWNQKASSFARRNHGSDYIDKLLPFIDVTCDQTVLDIGSGPGTIAIPLAKKAKAITALDFSPAMLNELKTTAAKEGLTNITTVLAAWEDDWHPLGVKAHDIAIASRSLSVDNLAAALVKLNNLAKHKVVITDRVGSGPFDPDVFAAVGRPFEPGPDYIITFNMLYQIGINASVNFIPAKCSEFYESKEEAIDSCLWMLEDLQPMERAGFDRFLDERLTRQSDGNWHLARNHTPEWAVISWNKD